MPQTFLALLALVLASIIAFNQQRLTQQSYRSALREEIQLAASGAAQHVLEMVAARSFDESTTPVPLFRAGAIPHTAAGFALAGTFGADRGALGCNLMDPGATPDCDDVDDLDGVAGAAVEARLTDGRVLSFVADAAVFYVDGPTSSTPSATPTLHKRVELRLRSEMPGLSRPILLISRVVSYDPIKAEAEMEVACGPMGSTSSPCA
jgi:hypothetical protein